MELLMGLAYAECFCESSRVWTLNQAAVPGSWEDRVSLQLSVCNEPFALCACLGERMVGRRSLLLRNFPGWLRGYPGK